MDAASNTEASASQPPRRAPYCLELNFLALKMLEKDQPTVPMWRRCWGIARAMLRLEALETEQQHQQRELTRECELRARCAEQASKLDASDARFEQQRGQLQREVRAACPELSERQQHEETKTALQAARDRAQAAQGTA